MVKIVQQDAVILRKICKAVSIDEFGSAELKKIIKDMGEALGSQHDGVAIAACQIGVLLRIFVVSGKIFSTEENEVENVVFINPVIKKLSRKKEDMDEGCLSVRWKYGMVKRAVKASVQAYTVNGASFTYNATGLLAQIFQHETDHLDGILFTDKAKDVKDINPEDLLDNKN